MTLDEKLAEAVANFDTTPYGEALLLQGAKPRRLEKGSGNVVISWISYKLFPRGSRRRNALKKLFGKRR